MMSRLLVTAVALCLLGVLAPSSHANTLGTGMKGVEEEFKFETGSRVGALPNNGKIQISFNQLKYTHPVEGQRQWLRKFGAGITGSDLDKEMVFLFLVASYDTVADEATLDPVFDKPIKLKADYERAKHNWYELTFDPKTVTGQTISVACWFGYKGDVNVGDTLALDSFELKDGSTKGPIVLDARKYFRIRAFMADEKGYQLVDDIIKRGQKELKNAQKPEFVLSVVKTAATGDWLGTAKALAAPAGGWAASASMKAYLKNKPLADVELDSETHGVTLDALPRVFMRKWNSPEGVKDSVAFSIEVTAAN